MSGNSFLLAVTIYLGRFTTRAAQGNCDFFLKKVVSRTVFEVKTETFELF